VAEKNTVYLSILVLSIIFLTCGSNPISNIRSASSITTKVVRYNEIVPYSMKSIILPGHPMTTSTPFAKPHSYFLFSTPPYKHAECRPNYSTHLWIYIANSRVGAKTSIIGPSPFEALG